MNKKLPVVFGLPGAGKSYVAQILEKKFQYYIHDSDNDIPKHMRDALNRRDKITDEMRREFINHMITSVATLVKFHDKLAVHQTFLKEFMRKQFLEAFSDAKFILVESPTNIREKRYMKRKYFNLGIDYLRQTSSLFEPPHIPHATIYNSEDGTIALEEQIRKVIRGNL